jgi:DnaJ-class molecular chaperone
LNSNHFVKSIIFLFFFLGPFYICIAQTKGETDKSVCQICNGSGKYELIDSCQTCKGKGKLSVNCQTCKGKGKIYCSACTGAGVIKQSGNFGDSYQSCKKCHGQGLVECQACEGKKKQNLFCEACGGKGLKKKNKSCDHK